MARGGMGDVLAGIIGSLMAQGLSSVRCKASLRGRFGMVDSWVYILSADRLADAHGETSVLPEANSDTGT